MHHIYSSLVLAAVSMYHSCAAFAQACPGVEVQVAFQALQSAAPIHQQGYAKDLTQFAAKQGGQSPHATVGLYQVSSRLELLSTMSRSTQGVCIENLNVTYSFNHAIQVARDYDPSSCLYRETIKHERQHEKIHDTYTRAALQGWANSLQRSPLFFNNSTEATAWLAKAKDHLTQHLKNVVSPQQQAHDSEQEYSKLAQVCDREYRYHSYTR